jgi:hypothetical protein
MKPSLTVTLVISALVVFSCLFLWYRDPNGSSASDIALSNAAIEIIVVSLFIGSYELVRWLGGKNK